MSILTMKYINSGIGGNLEWMSQEFGCLQANVLKNGLRTTDYEAWWDSLEWLVKLTLLELFDVADRGVMGGGLYNHVKLPTFV